MKKNKLLNVASVLLVCFVAAFFAACGGSTGVKKLYPIAKDGKWGYINNQGEIVIEPQFDAASDFSEGLALITKFDSNDSTAGKFGYIDETGKIVIEPQFQARSLYFNVDSSIYRFSEGVAVLPLSWADDKNGVMLPDKTVGIDKTGKTLFELDSNHQINSAFSDGLLLVKLTKPRDEKGQNFSYGYVDKTGKFVIESQDWSAAHPFSEGLASVTLYKTNTIYYGFIDTTGKTVIEPPYELVGEYHDGLAAATTRGNFKFIGKTPKEEAVVSGSGTPLTDFSEGLALILKNDNSLWIIDKDGEIVAPVEIPVSAASDVKVTKFEGGLLTIYFKSKLLYIDKKGKVVWNNYLPSKL